MVFVACATVQPRATVDELTRRASQCEDFAAFDAELHDARTALLANSAGTTLLEDDARLSQARRACTRTVLRRLSELQPDEVQTTLDALARSWPEAELKRLVHEVLGVTALDARLLEARAHAQGAPPDPTAEPRDPCADRREVCDAALCQVRAHSPTVEVVSRRCLDQALPAARLTDVSALVSALKDSGQAPSVVTEGLIVLETARRQVWPQVEAEAAGRPALAATLAAPFVVLDLARPQVEALRRAAVQRHLAAARAAQAFSDVAQLHRLIAAEFGGPSAQGPEPMPGLWDSSHWRCEEVPAPVRPVFSGARARLDATCRTRNDRPTTSIANGELATFDLERNLTPRVIEGTLRVTCAGRSSSYAVAVTAEVFSGSVAMEPLEAVLDAKLEQARRECAAVRDPQVCQAGTPDQEHRGIEAFVIQGHWNPCFVAAFRATWGVDPPILTPKDPAFVVPEPH